MQYLLGIAIDDETDGLLRGDAALVAVEELVFADFAGRCLMLEDGRVVMHIHIGEGMGTAVGAKEQRVARRIIAGIVGCCGSSYQSAIGVLGVSGRDALRNDGRLGVTPDVNHLCTGVSLLIVVGDGHRIELGLRIVTPQYAGGIFPSDSRAGLHLSPRQFGVNTAQVATLRHEVQDAAFTLLITGIPVLNR